MPRLYKISKAQKEWLRELYYTKGYTASEISRMSGISVGRLRSVFVTDKRHKKEMYTMEDYKKWRLMYEGGASLNDLVVIFKVGFNTLRSGILEAGGKIRKGTATLRKRIAADVKKS